MRSFAFTKAAMIGMCLHTAEAAYKFTEPDDLVGVLSDTIVPSMELCQAFCEENELCLGTLYHFKCNECWQLDCSVNNVVSGSDVIYDKKLTGKPFYYCGNDMRPEIPRNGCSNLTATATVTSVRKATETSPETQPSDTGAGKGGENGGTAIGMRHSWLGLGAALVVAGAFMA